MSVRIAGRADWEDGYRSSDPAARIRGVVVREHAGCAFANAGSTNA